MFIKNKYIKLLLTIFIFSISLVFPTFAEIEVEPTIDIYKNYEGWYKNFIVECGACRITLRDYDGNIINDFYVLPKQFENSSEITRILNFAGVDNQKDSEGRSILFMQKNEGKLNLNDYIYKALNGSELEKKYSDNIPQLAKIYNSLEEKLPYIYFKPFNKDFKTVEDWKNYNNGENVNNLAKDLGIDTATLCKHPDDNRDITFYEWVTTANSNGISPTLELQPITLYPETTEQIYCNDFYTAEKFNLQWNSDMGAYCEELNKGGIGGWFEGVLMKIFGGKKIGIGDLITFYNGKIVYYDVGVMITGEEEVGVETGSGKTYIEGGRYIRDKLTMDDIIPYEFEKMFPIKEERDIIKIGDLTDEQLDILLYSTAKLKARGEAVNLRNPSEISRIAVKEILQPKYVPLTYTETTKYSRPWETKGFWANYQRKDVSNINYTLEEMLRFYYSYNAITEADTIDLSNIKSSTDYDRAIGSKMAGFDSLEPKTEKKVEDLLKSLDKYYLDFESYYKMLGYVREGNNFHLPIYKGIGDATTIRTDHNKYVTIIKMLEEFKKTFELLLTLPDFLCTSYPKYGAGTILSGKELIATSSQILFKFHSNLDQIGGSGSIEEEYNLIGTIGSDIYISQHTGVEYKKIPKTYPDSIASSFTKEDGTNYTYKSYTTTQGLDGKAGSGKRFKVDSSKKLTQDLLDYAINKKEKENKKNLKERFEELGINTSNKLNEEEGFTEQISVNGKTYYVSEDDAERWNEEVSKYSDPDDETTSKYTDENGNEYYIIILYVDWLYDESGNVSDDFSLYEDELSYVFDYKSIHKSDDTRKLTGKAKKGTGGLTHHSHSPT